MVVRMSCLRWSPLNLVIIIALVWNFQILLLVDSLVSCTRVQKTARFYLATEGEQSVKHVQEVLGRIVRSVRKVAVGSTLFGASLLPLRPPVQAKPSIVAETPSVVKISSVGLRKPFDAPSGRTAVRNNGASSNFVREAVKVVGPSVVRVDCERDASAFMSNAFEGDTVKVSGSGIVVTTDGYLLTNSHVIQGAKSLTVTLSNGRTFKAAVVSFDELTDLAVLKADVGFYSLPVAPMGDSSSLASGDWVIAVGCPVGLDFTVTLGIVSSPKRSAFEVGASNLKGTYIQTDAALNSGNSGGPLVNDVGEVVGINTMVRTNTEAIGFAIPINRARQIYEILKQGKKPSHAYFGIEVMTLTPDFARIHNDDPNAQRLPEVHGALVVRVVPGSPAAACGFRKNDIIVEVNGDDVTNSEDADVQLDCCRPGSVTRLKVLRGEPSTSMELQATPLDLLNVIEQKRAREHMMGGLRPPAGASQGKADYFLPGSNPNPPASSEPATNSENDVINEHDEKITIPVILRYGSGTDSQLSLIAGTR